MALVTGNAAGIPLQLSGGAAVLGSAVFLAGWRGEKGATAALRLQNPGNGLEAGMTTEAASPVVIRTCPLCGKDNQGQPKLFPDLAWGLTRCQDCIMAYLEKVPPYEQLSEAIAWEDSWAREHQRRHAEEPVLHGIQTRVRRYFKRDKLTRLIHELFPRGRVLDVGCGNAHRSDRVLDPVCFYGIEIERSVIEEANRRFARRGGHVVCAPAIEGLATFDDGFFDGAILRAYLEHEMHPKEVLAALRPKLKTQAAVIIKVPNYGSLNRRIRGRKWCGYRFPEHVNYFTPDSLRRLIADTGYSVSRFRLNDRFPLSDNMWMVARKSG